MNNKPHNKPRRSVSAISMTLGTITIVAGLLFVAAGVWLGDVALTELGGSPAGMLLLLGAVLGIVGVALLFGAAVMLYPRKTNIPNAAKDEAAKRKPPSPNRAAPPVLKSLFQPGSITSIAIFSGFLLTGLLFWVLLRPEPAGPWLVVNEPFTEFNASGWPAKRFATVYRTVAYQTGGVAFEAYIDSKGNILGPAVWYYPDGSVHAKGNFKDGKVYGELMVHEPGEIYPPTPYQ